VITIVLLVNGIYALPYSKMSLENVTDPEWEKADFSLWYGWLDPILPMDEARFASTVRRMMWAQHETVRSACRGSRCSTASTSTSSGACSRW
jgi:hypothetical protein